MEDPSRSDASLYPLAGRLEALGQVVGGASQRDLRKMFPEILHLTPAHSYQSHTQSLPHKWKKVTQLADPFHTWFSVTSETLQTACKNSKINNICISLFNDEMIKPIA